MCFTTKRAHHEEKKIWTLLIKKGICICIFESLSYIFNYEYIREIKENKNFENLQLKYFRALKPAISEVLNMSC